MPDIAFNRKDALVSSEGRLGFSELRDRVIAAKDSLLASRPSSVHILEEKKSFEFVIEFLAALEAKVPVAVFSSEWTASEREQKRSILATHSNAIDPATAVILFTSGSSGSSRAVQLSLAGIEANTLAVIEALRFKKTEAQFLFLPLSYSYGLLGQLLPALAVGVTTHLLGSFIEARPYFLTNKSESAAHGMWSGVASQWSALLKMVDSCGPFSEVTHVISAGSRLDPVLKKKLREVFPAAILSNNYGLTEASPRILSMTSEDPLFFQDLTGYPVRGIETRIDEGGILEVKGPQIMLGYLGDELATSKSLQGGWLKTGDLAEKGAGGLVTIQGRNDDLVKISGERVSPNEIESIVLKLGWTTEVSVVPTEDPLYGTRLALFLGGRLRPDVVDKNDIELLKLLREVLSAAKVPTRIVRLGTLPRSINGKTDRQALRESLQTSERVRDCLVRSGWEFELPQDTESLVDLGFDSLGLALWVVEIEREFKIRISPKQVSFIEFSNLSRVTEIVEGYMKVGIG